MRFINTVLALSLLVACGAPPEPEEIGQTEQAVQVKDQGFGFQPLSGGPACKVASQSAGQQCLLPQFVTSSSTTIAWAIAQQSAGTEGGLSASDINDLNTAGTAAMNQINAALSAAGLPYSIVRWFDDTKCTGGDVWFGWPDHLGTSVTHNINSYYFPNAFGYSSYPQLSESFAGEWRVSGLGLQASACPKSYYGQDDYLDLALLKSLSTVNGLVNHTTYMGHLRHVMGAGMLGALGIGTQSGPQTTAYSSSVMGGLGGTSLGLTTHEACLLASVVQQGNNFNLSLLSGTCPSE